MNSRLIVIYLIVFCSVIMFVNVDIDAKGEELQTDYHVTLDKAVQIQVESVANPTTAVHAGESVFVGSDFGRLELGLYSFGGYVTMYEQPDLNGEVAGELLRGASFGLAQLVKVEADNRLWYEVFVSGKKAYVPMRELPFVTVRIMDEADVYDVPSVDGHVYGSVGQGSVHYVLGAGDEFYEVMYPAWRFAKVEDVARYMDPDHGNGLQHLRLDKLAHVTAEAIDDVLIGKGVLEGEGAAFVSGAEEAGINEAYLLAHAFLETGHGTSPLASGVEVGINDAGEAVVVTDENRGSLSQIETVYNMFGIEAVDSCPVECGAIKAYEAGWTSPGLAIAEGAEWIGKGYIYNEFEQNTLYKMRWNPQMKDGAVWKQYATDIGWAVKQTEMLQDIFDKWDHADMVFDYPVYGE